MPTSLNGIQQVHPDEMNGEQLTEVFFSLVKDRGSNLHDILRSPYVSAIYRTAATNKVTICASIASWFAAEAKTEHHAEFSGQFIAVTVIIRKLNELKFNLPIPPRPYDETVRITVLSAWFTLADDIAKKFEVK